MTLSALINARIDDQVGVPVDAVSDLRFAVQVAGAPSNAVLGTMILGTDPLTEVGWVDVTGDVHGATIERGSTAGTRPGIGQLTFRLNNTSGVYSPYESTYNGPGTLVRVLLSAPGIPDCLITGFTVAWEESADARNSTVRWVDVVCLETLSLLGEVDNNQQADQGAGENITARVARILTAAGWQLGIALMMVNFPTPAHALWGLQSTNLASVALTELYRTADSVGMVVRAHRNGTIIVASADYVPGDSDATTAVLGTMILGASFLGSAGSTFHLGVGTGVPIVANSIVTANNDDRLLDHISVARVGGAQVTYTTTGLAGRWQTRSTKRTDLVTQNPGANEDLARYAQIALAPGNNAYRVRRFKLDTAHAAVIWSMLRLLDIGTRCFISRQDGPLIVRFNDYLICGYKLNIIRQNEHTVRVTASIETDVGLDSTWEILDA